ncbi:MAG: sulfur carrier protein ThiS [Deltaproteobacteria bacterium]|nr:sulfur carrier protein ThiS [Deltaproteobacteria bacterium]
MRLVISGVSKEYPQGLTVKELLEAEKVATPEYVTVALNDALVDIGQFAATVLKDGDSVEFLYYMGGGALSEEELRRYSRNIILKEVGLKGQKRLAAGKVLVIGAGGLGSPALFYLAAAGVGVLGIADGDSVDLSNLQRQILHGAADVGKKKTRSAEESLRALNPQIRLRVHEGLARADNILDLIADYDFVIDGTDNFAAKFLINDACVLAGKPFSHAGIIRFTGQLLTYVPGRGPCYRCLFQNPPPPGAIPTCREAGVIGALAGTIGTLQAMEAMKYLMGIGELLTGALLTHDALNMDFRKIKVAARPGCAVCGERPTILEPRDYENPACEL